MGTATFEVLAERAVPAGVQELFTAWTQPDWVRQWWGPLGFTCPVADMDVREGGVSLVAMRAPAEAAGADMYNTWTCSRVVRLYRLEFTSRFSTAGRIPISPSAAGIPAQGVPESVPHVVTFTRIADTSSRIRVVESGYTTAQARDLSQAGMEQCLDKLVQTLGQGDDGSR